MAKKVYLEVEENLRESKKIYVSVNKLARKVIKGYIGVDKVARQFYDGNSLPKGTVSLMHLENDISNVITGEVISTPASSNFNEGKFGKCYGTTSGSTTIAQPFEESLIVKNMNELAKGGGKNLTLECWFKANQQVSNTASSKVIIRFPGSNAGVLWWYDTYQLILNASQKIEITDADSPYKNWVHIALVCNNGTCSVFINGKKKGSLEIVGSTSSVQFQFGAMYGGQFDEVLISTEALYTEDFTPPTAPYEVEV